MSDKIKVVLLGDSIRENYAPRTIEKLGAAYDVWMPSENCRFVKNTMRGVFYDWRDNIVGSDIIHFNCGLWDTCDLIGDGPFSSIDEYTAQLVRVSKELQRISKTVIFATITPVKPLQPHNTNVRIIEYNKAAVKALENLGVVIDDLFTPVYNDLENTIREDDQIHLTNDAIELCSGIVANCIRRAAAELSL